MLFYFYDSQFMESQHETLFLNTLKSHNIPKQNSLGFGMVFFRICLNFTGRFRI
jgi:hypothetical protein